MRPAAPIRVGVGRMRVIARWIVPESNAENFVNSGISWKISFCKSLYLGDQNKQICLFSSLLASQLPAF
jgi:hypothetical protein